MDIFMDTNHKQLHLLLDPNLVSLKNYFNRNNSASSLIKVGGIKQNLSDTNWSKEINQILVANNSKDRLIWKSTKIKAVSKISERKTKTEI